MATVMTTAIMNNVISIRATAAKILRGDIVQNVYVKIQSLPQVVRSLKIILIFYFIIRFFRIKIDTCSILLSIALNFFKNSEDESKHILFPICLNGWAIQSHG